MDGHHDVYTKKDLMEQTKWENTFLMNTCIKCDVEMDDYRLHLGYKNVPIVVKKKVF